MTLTLTPDKPGASFHRGKSAQDQGTPWDFVRAVEHKLGNPIMFDLAANSDNQKGPIDCYYDESRNSLIQPWSKLGGLLWLNPPYANIEPWAHKCRIESAEGAEIANLVPASVSTEWWALHVHMNAHVYFVRPRIKFVGCKDGYPRDLALLHWGPSVVAGYSVWRWK